METSPFIKTNRVFSSIAIDQAHEQHNAYVKGDGGAVGLTNNPSTLRRWMIAGPELARVIEEFHARQNHCKGKVTTLHHDQIPSVQSAYAKDVRSLVSVIEDLGNPFQEESTDLLVLDSKEIADQSAVKCVRNAQRIGQDQFQTFTKECLIKRSKPIDDVLHHNRLKLFGSTAKKNSNKGKQLLTSLKCNMGLFARLYIGCQNRDGNLEEFFRHENQAYPPSLSDDSTLHLGTKSDLLLCLNDCSETQSQTPVTSCAILDGAAIVAMLKPDATKTFSDFASKVFVPHILLQDRYVANSLKASTRVKRGKGVRRRIVAGAIIPGDWKGFLHVESNKVELFKFLSEVLLVSFSQEDKQLVITDNESAISKPLLQNLASLAPCSHEEADSRMQIMQHTMVIRKL